LGNDEMSNTPEYWIWLQTALGAGARTDEILAYFESPEELYKAGFNEWRLSGLFTEKRLAALQKTSLNSAIGVIDECCRKGYEIVTPDDAGYPSNLKNLIDMPLALYVSGDASVLQKRVCIGIVGTRNASSYGEQTAQKLSYQLASSGAVIVSGGALGVDSEAHAGAMLADGKTIAFLGCGLSFDYLKENSGLRRAIARHGAVVSEFQPNAPASRTTFPIRNRLISGVSLGVVVIEAGVKSGSLVTAKKAYEQGRDVFAVPGNVTLTSFDGTNHLIRNGAKPVFSAMDVLCEYENEYAEEICFDKAESSLSGIKYVDFRNYKKQKAPQKSEENINTISEKTQPVEKSVCIDDVAADLSDNAKIVYGALDTEPVYFDDIVRKTKLNMNIVLSSLSELEIFGLAESVSGKRYKKI